VRRDPIKDLQKGWLPSWKGRFSRSLCLLFNRMLIAEKGCVAEGLAWKFDKSLNFSSNLPLALKNPDVTLP